MPVTAAGRSPRTPVPSATLRPPNATVSAEMDVIQLQVAELRGLAILSSVPRFLLSPERLEKSLEALLLTEADRARLVDDARVLTALGLIKPTYDLARYAINHQVDNIGGFYIPRAREIYVIGGRFSGIERWVYSHEFGHALVDQHFDIGAVGVYPDCRIGQQQCDAVRALVEGDATLLMEQWWLQYASPRDYQDILNYRPPAQTLPEQFPPPFVVADASFPYDYGYEFVRQLHARGNWAAVNSAYASLPQTTEQIMHPEKYTAGEGPVDVTAPPVGQALGAGWRELANDSLGEWDTFLLLGYAADLEAQINLFAASEAAAGWGGDNYQVHYHDTLSQTVLAVHWVWDTSADAREFNTAFDLYLDRLFRGAKADGRAACWQPSGQAACYFTAGRATLWLAGPDLATVDGLLGLYPDFQ